LILSIAGLTVSLQAQNPGEPGQGGQGGMMGPGGQGGQGGMMGPGGQGGMMGPGGQGGMMGDMPFSIFDISRGLYTIDNNKKYKLSKVQKGKVLVVLRKMDDLLGKTEENSALMEKIFTREQLDYIKSCRSSGMQGMDISAPTAEQIKQGIDPIITAAIKSLKEKTKKKQHGGSSGAQQSCGQIPGGAQSAPGQQ